MNLVELDKALRKLRLSGGSGKMKRDPVAT